MEGIESASPFDRRYGLAVLSRHPERAGSHIAKLMEVAADAGLVKAGRTRAMRLVEAQAPAGERAPNGDQAP